MKNEFTNGSPCENMANNKVTREYKVIAPERILDIEKYGILPIGTDEVFALIDCCTRYYISNYGRCAVVTDKCKLLNGTNNNGKLAYKINLWVYGEEYSMLRNADALVVETFIEHEVSDKKMFIWHSGGNNEDNYYRNLYPMNTKEYRALTKFVENGGYDSEEKILEIMSTGGCNEPTVLGKGYWGSPEIEIMNPIYRRWSNMLARCYSEKFQQKQSSYLGCTVADEWLNYTTFKKWVEENYYTVDDEPMELDKDILNKGNTVYSSDNCVFVPKSINSLIINATASRGEYPVGVDYYRDQYRARMSYDGRQIIIGNYDTPEEAFQGYKEYKEKFIKDIAERYKEKIPEKLYNALINWTIEEDD